MTQQQTQITSVTDLRRKVADALRMIEQIALNDPAATFSIVITVHATKPPALESILMTPLQ